MRRGTERCAWFFATSLASRFVLVPRWLWGLPWARSRARHEARYADGRLEDYQWHAKSEHGSEELSAVGTGQSLGRLDGFADAAETHRVLTHPLVGFLRKRKRGVVSYAVWHEPLTMEIARPERARFTLYEDLDLIDRAQIPASVLVQPCVHYLVKLPPHAP